MQKNTARRESGLAKDRLTNGTEFATISAENRGKKGEGMRKGICLLAGCVLLCIWVAGCKPGTSAEISAETSAEPSSQDVLSTPSVSEPSSASKPTISDPVEESSFSEESSSANESSIGGESSVGGEEPPPHGETLAVCAGLCFRLPERWGVDPASASDMLFFASAEDGSRSVSATYTALETVQGLTEPLLIEAFRGSLSASWTDAGATDVRAASVAVSLLGEPHEALSLTASINGRAVCQLQVYLLRSDGLYTLTVTAGDLQGAKALLAAFEEA